MSEPKNKNTQKPSKGTPKQGTNKVKRDQNGRFAKKGEKGSNSSDGSVKIKVIKETKTAKPKGNDKWQSSTTFTWFHLPSFTSCFDWNKFDSSFSGIWESINEDTVSQCSAPETSTEPIQQRECQEFIKQIDEKYPDKIIINDKTYFSLPLTAKLLQNCINTCAEVASKEMDNLKQDKTPEKAPATESGIPASGVANKEKKIHETAQKMANIAAKGIMMTLTVVVCAFAFYGITTFLESLFK